MCTLCRITHKLKKNKGFTQFVSDSPVFHLISSQSLNPGVRWGTTDDVATIPFHPSLSSGALRESPNSIPVLKRVGENRHRCRTPTVILNHSPVLPRTAGVYTSIKSTK